MRRSVGSLAVLLVLLVTAACSSHSSSGTPGADPSFSASVAPVAGCGAGAATDPANRSPSRAVARCDAGAPAAQPLKTRTTIKVAIQTKGEYWAPLLVGMATGEYAKENLNVQLVTLPFSDQIPQLANGAIDISLGGPYASLVNAVNSGFDIRWALGNFSPPHGSQVGVPQSGLWFRRDAFTDPAHPSLATLKSKTPTVANTQGGGTPAVLWLDRAFASGGIKYSQVKWQQLSPADQVTALRTGAVQGAYLLDPFWRELAGSPDYVQLAVPDKEVNGGVFYGPTMLTKHPDVGEAFARAWVRTVNTYLNGDYKKNAKVVSILAGQLGVAAGVVQAGDPLTFDWEVPGGLMTDLQKLYIAQGDDPGMTGPLSESRLVTRVFYGRAVGHVSAG